MKQLALSIGGQQLTLPGQINTLVQSTTNYGNGNTLQGIISFVIGAVLTVAILLAFFFLLIGGIKWIMSGGDKKQLENAQKTIQYALIGLIVVLLSFFIINLIGFAFGSNLHLLQVRW